jgi:hypothetical protein
MITYIFYKLQSKLSERKQQKDAIKIFLECFLDMMVNFIPKSENTEIDYFENMYHIFLLMCQLHKTPDVINKILCILSAHMKHFSSFVFKDYEKWHEFFKTLYKNSPTYKIADTLRAFYKIIPYHLLEDQKDDIFKVIEVILYL